MDTESPGEAGPAPGDSTNLPSAALHSRWSVKSITISGRSRVYQNWLYSLYRYFLTYNWAHPSPGSLSQEESSSQPTPILDEVPRDETQEHQPPQLEEEQRVWQRLEQLILGQVRNVRDWVGVRSKNGFCPDLDSSTAGRAETAAGAAGGRAE